MVVNTCDRSPAMAGFVVGGDFPRARLRLLRLLLLRSYTVREHPVVEISETGPGGETAHCRRRAVPYDD